MITKQKVGLDLAKEMYNIFNHYIDKYKLDLQLAIDTTEHHNCFYNPTSKYINIDLEYIAEIYHSKATKKRHKYNSFRELAIIVLLHEIEHAIHYKYHREDFLSKQMEERFSDILQLSYYPLEKDADDFANTEIRRWVK